VVFKVHPSSRTRKTQVNKFRNGVKPDRVLAAEIASIRTKLVKQVDDMNYVSSRLDRGELARGVSSYILLQFPAHVEPILLRGQYDSALDEVGAYET